MASASNSVVSVHDQIASRLRQDVRNGVLAPGEPLREEHLAARFGVSRSPIRQVLRQLTFEGLLHARPNCGMVVSPPPATEVLEALYQCRARLECIALRRCFDHLDSADFEQWEKILASLADCCRRKDYAGADQQDWLFHRVIVDKAAASGSMGVYFAIAAATRDYSIDRNHACYKDFRELHAIHAALLAMFRLGDVDIACEALAQHILKEDFNAAACKRWYKAGKPQSAEKIYDPLARTLRQAAKRRRW
jgi:DNA-binding GntR family transcriptional regulator